MKKDDVVAKLVEIHRDYQRGGGYDDEDKVQPPTSPLDGLKGFESDFIPEIVRRLARDLGHPFPEGTRVKNIYVSQDGKRKLSIEEIAQRFIDTYAGQEAKA
jgi:hypothetical protein